MQTVGMPRVLKYKREWKREGLPPGSVYIGRAVPRYGLQRSKWANPYKEGRDGTRGEVIRKYEQYLVDSGPTNDVHEMRGKDLV